MGQIRRDLPNNQYQAAVLSNNASAANVFATIADLNAVAGTAESITVDVKISQAGGITKGQAVYVNGVSGTNILVGKADYSTELTSSKTLGLLVSSGANNDMRTVVTQGLLKGTGSEPLNTTAGAAGDPVWLGDDGNLIYGLVNKPYAPNHLVFIGIVVESNPTVGEIFVKVQNGFELDELHDVQLKGAGNLPLDGEVLTYEASTQLWKAKPVVSQNDSPLVFVIAATEAALVGSPIYDNGLSNDGIGATLIATSNGVLSDGTAVGRVDTNYIPEAGDLVLVKNQANQFHNGVYEITDTGSASTPYILTRSIEVDEPIELYPLQINVFQGLVNGSKYFTQTNTVWGDTPPPTVGTADIIFTLTSLTTTPLQITFVDNATSAPLPACTYTPGTDGTKPGVGALLTANANGLLVVSEMNAGSSTVSATAFTTLLVKNQAEPRHNGTYQVINPGSPPIGLNPGARWILRRIDDLAAGFNKALRIVFCSHNQSQFSGSYFIPTWNPGILNKNIGIISGVPLATNRIDYVGNTPSSNKAFGVKDSSGAFRLFDSFNLQRAIDTASSLLPFPNSNNQTVSVEVFTSSVINANANTVAITNAGTGYTAGTYNNVNLTGGSGTGMQATVVVSVSGNITSVTISSAGTGYVINDVLSVSGIPLLVGGVSAILTLTNVQFTPIQLRDRVNINGNNNQFLVISTTAFTGNLFRDNGANVNVNINNFNITKLVAGASNYFLSYGSCIRITGNESDIDLDGTELNASFCTALDVSPGTISTGTSSVTIGTNSGYTGPGTYNSIALVGGSGTGAIAQIVVSAGFSVTSVNITNGGTGYRAGDILTLPNTIPFTAGTAALLTVTAYDRANTRISNANITILRGAGIDMTNGNVSEMYVNDITNLPGSFVNAVNVSLLGTLSDCTVRYTSGSSGINNISGKILNCDVYATVGTAITNGGTTTNLAFAMDCLGYSISGAGFFSTFWSVSQRCNGHSVNGNGISINGQFNARLFSCIGSTLSTTNTVAGIGGGNGQLYDCIGYNAATTGGGSGIRIANGNNGTNTFIGCTGLSVSGPGLSSGITSGSIVIADGKYIGGGSNPGIFFLTNPNNFMVTGCTISAGAANVPCIGNMFINITTAATTALAGTYAGTLNGGNGTGATASITVAGGLVTAITVTASGNGYLAGDVLTITAAPGAQFTVQGTSLRYASNKFLVSSRPVYAAITQLITTSTQDSFGNIKID